LLLALPALAPAAPPAPCALPGELVQWVADYCMQSLQTDDEIAASACIGEQLARPFDDACAARTHYKRAMCAQSAAVAEGARSLADCLADPDFVGPTVRNGGVGG
jgi:hypothetical protein